jgi:hypothetical protein
MLITSRNSTTPVAQREFWLEFSWIDQEYRVAVRNLAQFCLAQGRRVKTLQVVGRDAL